MSSAFLKELCSVCLSNDKSLIYPLQNFAGQIAEMIGFSFKESEKIQLALEEACTGIIQHSFSPDEKGEYTIRFIQRIDGLEIHLHDMGIPYDPDMEPLYNPSEDVLKNNLEGLSSFLIRRTMDEYRYNNLGVKGKELVLIKYLKTPRIAEESPEPVQPEIVLPPSDRKPPEQIEFSIRPMKSGEALEVCRCIYDCYGYSYANENVYFPDRVAAMNLEGKLISALGVTPEGEIGSHTALIFHDYLPPEIGIAVTKKKFRGQGIARQISEYLEDIMKAKGHNGLQIREVTAHPYTQKFCKKLGYKDCGLLLGHSPKSLSFKGIADILKYRNSDVLGFKYLTEPEARTIYAPVHHQKMMTQLFHNIGVDVECLLSKNPAPEEKQCITEVKIHSLRSLAEMYILAYGKDTLPVIRREMRKIFADDIQVVELYLSLADPVTPAIVPQLEELGFIFTGILPETAQKDSMIMQYFNGVHINYDDVILISDLAQELLDYVRWHDPYDEGNT